jgi:hypothetical protein
VPGHLLSVGSISHIRIVTATLSLCAGRYKSGSFLTDPLAARAVKSVASRSGPKVNTFDKVGAVCVNAPVRICEGGD